MPSLFLRGDVSRRARERRPVLVIGAAILTGAIVSCGLPALPPPITDAEIASLGVTQGIAGRSAMRTGDCMPGCGLRTCAVERVPLSLRVLKPEPRLTEAGPDAGTCVLRDGATLSLTGLPLASVAELSLAEKDQYAVGLDAGEYQLALVDDAGCAFCPRVELDEDAGIQRCALVQVEPGAVTRVDLRFNLAAE